MEHFLHERYSVFFKLPNYPKICQWGPVLLVKTFAIVDVYMHIPTCYVKIQILLMKQAHKKQVKAKLYIDKTIGINKTIN